MKKNLINQICKYLQMENQEVKSNSEIEIIKELCVARLCKSIGIRCEYNYKSDFFEFFSNVTGEAVCIKLGLNYHIIDDFFKFYRFEHKNLLEEVIFMLENENKDEAFIDIFNLFDRFKYLLPIYKRK